MLSTLRWYAIANLPNQMTKTKQCTILQRTNISLILWNSSLLRSPCIWDLLLPIMIGRFCLHVQVLPEAQLSVVLSCSLPMHQRRRHVLVVLKQAAIALILWGHYIINISYIHSLPIYVSCSFPSISLAVCVSVFFSC